MAHRGFVRQAPPCSHASLNQWELVACQQRQPIRPDVLNLLRGSVMSTIEEAVRLFHQGCSCSQAILAAYGPKFGLQEAAALQLASGFGGGMGRMGSECGAVTGAMMVLGLCFGPKTADDTAARERVYELVRRFAERFRERRGTLLCRELLPCNIGTPEGLDEARRRGLFRTVCPDFVRDAAEILEELLEA